jgi:DNA repair ATPase RecN
MKAKMEFKISTEASSLSQERDIVRKINEINQELGEALASVRLERKTGFVKGDIEEYKKSITEINGKIQELDNKLDSLYANLRKVLGIGMWQNKQQMKPKRTQQPVQGINLEDIVVIKKKDSKQ